MTLPATLSAVIVTYHPDPATLGGLIAGLRPQVDHLIVFDNTPGGAAVLTSLGPDLTVLGEGRNLGIATALNRGIAEARRQGATEIIFFDQDSQPAADCIARLRDGWQAAQRRGLRPGAVGPQHVDPRDADPTNYKFIRTTGGTLSKVCAATDADADGLIACDALITSGCLTTLAVLDDVGGMVEELFIDAVDIEWSFRALSKGYTLFGVAAAHVRHTLGDRVFQPAWWRRLPVLKHKRASIHSPMRQYFIMRNRFFMLRQPYVPQAFRRLEQRNIVLRLVLFSLFVPPRWRNLRYMLRGLADGLRGRFGPLPDDLRQ